MSLLRSGSTTVTVLAAGRPAAAISAGISSMLVAVTLFAVMDALIKWLAADYSTVQLVFFRSVFGLVPVAVMVWHAGGPAVLRTRRYGLHAIRCGIGVVSTGMFFASFALLPFADVIALSFAGPLFLTALSVPVLGEKVGVRRWCAVLVGFAGVLLIVRPGSGVLGAAALLPLGGALGYALAMAATRRLARTDPTVTIVFWFTASCAVTSGALLPWFWTTPTALDTALLVCIGLIGGLGQLTLTHAFRLAPAAVVAPFEYTAILWAVVLGLLVWHEEPDLFTLAGSAVVIASGLFILARERVRAVDPVPASRTRPRV